MKLDYYQILGVASNASPIEIRAAYKSRAQQLHPDAGGSEEAFKELTQAYKTLKDPSKRAIYNLGLRQGFDHQQFTVMLNSTTAFYAEQILGSLQHGTFSVIPSLKQMLNGLMADDEQSARSKKREGKRLLKRVEKLHSRLSNNDSIVLKAIDEKSKQIQNSLHEIEMRLAIIKLIREDTELIEENMSEVSNQYLLSSALSELLLSKAQGKQS